MATVRACYDDDDDDDDDDDEQATHNRSLRGTRPGPMQGNHHLQVDLRAGDVNGNHAALVFGLEQRQGLARMSDNLK